MGSANVAMSDLPLNACITFLGAAVAVWLLSFPIIRGLKARQVLDRPNERSSHAVPTPRGGGLALVCVLIPALLFVYWITREPFALLLAVCSLLLSGISFIDDLRPITPVIRFSIHLAAALVLLVGLAYYRGNAHQTAIPGTEFLLGIMFCLYLVGYSNAFNFMDGINGIAGCQALLSGVGVASIAFIVDSAELWPVALAAALVAGAAGGFLPHNFPRARVFMGDVGSVPLGFITAGLGVVVAMKGGLWLIVPVTLLHANFILDTSITLARRVLRGEKWYLPHREHFYQRLVRSGKSHTFVTGSEVLLQLVTLALALAYLKSNLVLRILLVGAVLLLWLAFFAWAEVRFRASQAELNSASGLAPGVAK